MIGAQELGLPDVLNTHANCGLHINRYEKVKVSFSVKETERLAGSP